jgi:hypothetical protein
VRLAFSDDAGETFHAPVELDSGSAALGRVDVAMLPDGRALVTWLHRRGSDRAEVRVAAVNGSGTVAWTSSLGETDAARGSGFPRMVRTANGALVAWTFVGRTTEIRLHSIAPR